MEYAKNALDYAKAIEVDQVIKSIKGVKVDRKLVIEVTAAGVLGLGVIYIGKIWSSYGFFKKIGIKTPPFRFLYGNIDEMKEKGYADLLVEWTQKFGKTYGYYEGHLPILVTSDTEIIDEVFFKQFSNFSGRKIAQQQLSDDSEDVNVFLSSKNRWKRLRTISNQTFSPAKLKGLLPAMRMCTDRLIDAISKKLDQEINITDLMEQCTMDIIWNCTIGIDIDPIKNPDFIYFVRIKELLSGFADPNLFFKLTTYFYEFKPVILISSFIGTILMSQINSKWGNPFFWLLRQTREVLDERVKNPSKEKHDYVQLLLEAEADHVNLDFDNQHYESGNTKLLEKKMTRREIITSLVGFMAAGFDTTASTINFCLYVLLAHPEELAKVQEEVDNLVNYDYESLNELEYLDMFLKEVLRMYPTGVIVQNRRCTKATTIKGIDIPEDLTIAVDVLSLHYDPENWPGVDPQVFYPLRFGPGAKYNKLAYMPFGAGARICIGMRFAILEIKLILAKILKNFEISTVSPLSERPKIKDGVFAVRKVKDPLRIVFKSRN